MSLSGDIALKFAAKCNFVGGETVEEERKPDVGGAAENAPARCLAFYGSHEHSLDGKGRMIIPNAYRKALGNTFTVSITPEGDSIALYPDDVFDAMMDELNQLNNLNPSVRRYLSYLSKMSFRDVEPDSQGRILIPARLRQRILKDAIKLEISGRIDHVCICDAQKGNDEDDYFEENREDIVSDVSSLRAELMSRKGDVR